MLTWPLASTAIVVLTLALSLAWYERSRPSARLVALIATMAALAVVGRIAFAPIPNVKPTTDLILLSGLAFGAVPGFAVGSTTALVSNLFFGQGIHTPWQMLAWGGVGLLGALAGRALGHRPARLPLAVICAFAGLAFGAFMDLSIWATVGGQHTLAEYGVISLRSLPFNIAHAVGNAAFAIAFAPIVLGALARARARAKVTVHPLGAPAAARTRGVPSGAALGLVLAALATTTLLATPQASRAATPGPIDYLLDHQTKDGGFGAAGASATLDSGWAAMALGASAGVPRSARTRAIGYLRSAAKGATDPGDLERFILGLRGLGAPATDIDGRDLVAVLLAQQKPDGSFAGLVNQTAFGILALRAAGRSRSSKPVKRATEFLLDHANDDGGFSYSGKGTSGVDDTAGAIQALVAAGRKGNRVTKAAIAFLRGTQQPDGGFVIGDQSRSNAMSTAWAAQAFIAIGEDPAKVKAKGRSPIQLLRSLTVDDGHVRYSRVSDQTPVWVTAQAQLALAGSPLPIIRADVAAAAGGAATAQARREARRAKRAKRARKLARREARHARQAKDFSTDVLAPAAGGVVLLAALFRVG
jgi:energy-coupling factor transport system substrate-specific component